MQAPATKSQSRGAGYLLRASINRVYLLSKRAPIGNLGVNWCYKANPLTCKIFCYKKNLKYKNRWGDGSSHQQKYKVHGLCKSK